MCLINFPWEILLIWTSFSPTFIYYFEKTLNAIANSSCMPCPEVQLDTSYWLRSSASVLFCAFTRMGQIPDYRSHFKLSGFVMVEHRDAGSQLEEALLSLWRSNGLFWRFIVQCYSSSSEALNGAPPPPVIIKQAVREVEWPPGWPRETSIVSLLSNLWLPNWGLGMQARGVLSLRF